MIKIKIEKNKRNEPVFKMGISDDDVKKYPFLRRALMEAKKLKGIYNYKIPLRFFVPIYNNINKEEIKIDKKSNLEFLEFWDEFEEKYYSTIEANAKFMKSWREENCPNIFKISIDSKTLNLKKEVAFKKIKITLN